nr:tRNA (N6-isopentenyl adenosine(37)-C2)-methylthiotransferase MiaB [Acholeplasmatales bacterium]
MARDLDKELENMVLPSLTKARLRRKANIETIHYKVEDLYRGLGNGRTYYIYTYGCQGNEADSEIMAGILESVGFTHSEEPLKADVVLLNTCAVRENAEQRIWGVLGQLKGRKRNNPDMLIGICGCMPQEEKATNRLLESYPFVDLVFGTHNRGNLPKLIYQAYFTKSKVVEVLSNEGNILENAPKVRESNFKAWVHIMYGCDEFCTYCIVPYTRGKERSRAKEDIINEVNDLVKEGYIEVTLLGQNVNAYGKDLGNGEYTFGDLLFDIDKTGIQRVRFTSPHPRDMDDRAMEAMAKCKSVMPNLHFPVQSGNDKVLKIKNRKYTREIYLEKIKKLKELVPGISITTDIIVGYPGETYEEFKDTVSLVEEAKFEGAFTFIFSPREGTPAFSMEDPISLEDKHKWFDELVEHTNKGYLNGHEKFIGKTVKVLVDGESKS